MDRRVSDWILNLLQSNNYRKEKYVGMDFIIIIITNLYQWRDRVFSSSNAVTT
jgi:hypothetical protein